ncbi:hypothetical protein SRHO_G00021850 [Serrasalmus rhombeus]
MPLYWSPSSSCSHDPVTGYLRRWTVLSASVPDHSNTSRAHPEGRDEGDSRGKPQVTSAQRVQQEGLSSIEGQQVSALSIRALLMPVSHPREWRLLQHLQLSAGSLTPHGESCVRSYFLCSSRSVAIRRGRAGSAGLTLLEFKCGSSTNAL